VIQTGQHVAVGRPHPTLMVVISIAAIATSAASIPIPVMMVPSRRLDAVRRMTYPMTSNATASANTKPYCRSAHSINGPARSYSWGVISAILYRSVLFRVRDSTYAPNTEGRDERLRSAGEEGRNLDDQTPRPQAHGGVLPYIEWGRRSHDRQPSRASKPSVTLGLYAHVVEGAERSAVDVLGDRLTAAIASKK